MELKKISMAFSISTLVSLVYPSLGQENGDNHPLVNLGPEMDAVEAVLRRQYSRLARLQF